MDIVEALSGCDQWALYTFVYPAEAPEVHLVRAVEHHHIFPQRFPHVFCSLSFAGTCGAGWSATH